MAVPASLCSFCTTLIKRAWLHASGNRPTLSRSRRQIQTCGGQGCPMCIWFRMELDRMAAQPSVVTELPSSPPQSLEDVIEVEIAKVTLRGVYARKNDMLRPRIGTMDIEIDLLSSQCDPALISVSLTAREAVSEVDVDSRCSDQTGAQSSKTNSSLPHLVDRCTSTGSESSFNQAKEWLDQCLTSHSRCKEQALRRSSRPSRLIHLSPTPQGSIHACVRETSQDGIPDDARYTTLTHRWISEETQRLTTTTLEEFRNCIPIRDLKVAVQDAMKITIRLGMQYLWVDSLCIIQDDGQDKAKEITKMHSIYGNSSCTIVASWAKSLDDGCFSARHDASAACYAIKLELGDNFPKQHCLTRSWADGYSDVQASHLNSRAWIFQEFFLSPRLLYYGQSQMFWECDELDASEMHPRGAPDGSRQETRLRQLKRSMEELDPIRDQLHLHEVWSQIVEMYCSRKMTFEEDRLLGLAGVAGFVQAWHGDEYVAGHLKTSLPYSLLWAANKHGNPDLPDNRFRRLRIAPSWSWGSLSCRDLSFITVSNAAVPALRLPMSGIVDDRRIQVIDHDRPVWNLLACLVDYTIPVASKSGQGIETSTSSIQPLLKLSGRLREIGSNVRRYREPYFGFLACFDGPTESALMYPDFAAEFTNLFQQNPMALRLLPIVISLRSQNCHGLMLAQVSRDGLLPTYRRIGFYTSTIGTTNPFARPLKSAGLKDDSQDVQFRQQWMGKFHTWPEEEFWLC